MKLINLTNNEITLPNGDVIPPSGFVARANVHHSQVSSVNGIPLLKAQIAEINNIPTEVRPDIMYIVPTIVREFLSDRPDVISPCKLIRNTQGKVFGCGAFEVNKCYVP